MREDREHQRDAMHDRIGASLGERVAWPWLLALYVGLALVTGAASWNTRYARFGYAVETQHAAWRVFQTRNGAAEFNGTITGLYSTRILFPAVVAGVATLTGLSWDYAFVVVRLLSILATYLVFHRYLRGWFPTETAMLGTIFIAATFPLTFNQPFEIPTDFLEILTYTLGLWFIRDGHNFLLCVAIMIGTLNRETTLFLPLIHLLCQLQWRQRPVLTQAKVIAGALSIASWLLPVVLVRWWTGPGWTGLYGVSLTHNVTGVARFFVNFNIYNNYLFYIYLFGVLWILPFAFWHRQPHVLRCALLTVPAILAVYLLVGYMDEPREIVFLYPFLVPAGLFALSSGARGVYRCNGT